MQTSCDQPVLFVQELFPACARVHDARAARSKHSKEGMKGREVWGAAARLRWGIVGNGLMILSSD